MGSLKSESSPSSSDSQTEPKNERCRTRKTTLAASDGIAEQKNISTLSSMSSSAPRWKTSRCELLQDQTKGEPYTLKNVSTVRGKGDGCPSSEGNRSLSHQVLSIIHER